MPWLGRLRSIARRQDVRPTASLRWPPRYERAPSPRPPFSRLGNLVATALQTVPIFDSAGIIAATQFQRASPSASGLSKSIVKAEWISCSALPLKRWSLAMKTASACSAWSCASGGGNRSPSQTRAHSTVTMAQIDPIDTYQSKSSDQTPVSFFRATSLRSRLRGMDVRHSIVVE